MLNMTAHGNLGRDPELKEVGSTQVASFSMPHVPAKMKPPGSTALYGASVPTP